MVFVDYCRPMVVVYARIVGWVRTARVQYFTDSYGVALVLSNMEQFSHHGGENEKIREMFPFPMPMNACGIVP
jgi:hypothetical protein